MGKLPLLLSLILDKNYILLVIFVYLICKDRVYYPDLRLDSLVGGCPSRIHFVKRIITQMIISKAFFKIELNVYKDVNELRSSPLP